jgi:hypothetical protein
METDDRWRLLRRLADALEGEQENLARLESKNTGKPIGDSGVALSPHLSNRGVLSTLRPMGEPSQPLASSITPAS